MKRLRHALAFGIIIGIGAILLLLSPLGRNLEDTFGLALLFKMRGALPTPSEAVIVNIDDKSSEQLNLTSKIEDWPRDIYADLVSDLTDLGAAVIVFDIHFSDSQDEANDQKFANAIHQAGNVILYQKLVRLNKGSTARQDVSTDVEIEQLISPTPLLDEAALASAPFPIPKIPRRTNQAWTFKVSSGDMPTLPVVALQALTLTQYESFYNYIKEITGSNMDGIPLSARQATEQVGLIEIVRQYRQLLLPDSGTSSVSPRPDPNTAASNQEDEGLFQALVETYQGANNIYINFYGPAGTLKTFSLLEVLSGNKIQTDLLRTAIHDKVVFVGAAKTSTWSEQSDGVFTVFTQQDGLDLSGVEVAASVFVNLLNNSHLKPLPISISIVLLICSAIIFSITSFTLPPMISIAILLAAISSCFIAANQLFIHHDLWLPVVTWLILMPPVIFICAIISRFIRTQRERTHIKKALNLYLPNNVVEEISGDLTTIRTGDRMVYGVCLSTDAQNYTTLSESLEPMELSSIMKDYFEMMFKSVNQYGGLVCNVVGDAMFSLWPSTDPSMESRQKACNAALDILETIESFNKSNPGRALPTRIGLHSGNLLMGNIGAEGHYEYAPVGDIVNTASRIENINKKLGTWILASEETVRDCNGIDTRRMGTFLMSGKRKPVTLYQLLPDEVRSAPTQRLYNDAFPEALHLFKLKQWENAEKAFRTCLALNADDGPSLFYLKLSSDFIKHPPDKNWDGVISLKK